MITTAAVLIAMAALAGGGCSLPVGAFARPAQTLGRGDLWAAATGEFVAASHGRRAKKLLPPARGTVAGTVSFDAGVDGRRNAGVALGLLPIDPHTRIWTGALRGEQRFVSAPHLAIAVELHVGAVDSPAPLPDEPPWAAPPWLDAFPLFGLRYYLPLAGGGLVFTQMTGLTVASVTAPGSIGGDLPLGRFHLLPELRWDPTYSAADSLRFYASVSANLTVGARF